MDDTAQLIEYLLINWGRWCRDDIHHRLGYTKVPTSVGYVTPRSLRKGSLPIDYNDAQFANAAILSIALAEFPRDDIVLLCKPWSIYVFICEYWAYHLDNQLMAQLFDCSPRTIRRRKNRARDEFWCRYQSVQQDIRKIA